ncbi:hypothetical protein [Pseudonocardia aurantiaca]|uniref:Uncharacterized protein n=1 Tax=Pseudonocardia aurantiaca TaxID=75290 RepID=A0ABW4FDT7_9PSEU
MSASARRLSTTIGRALRALMRADDELARREWAESVAQALDDLEL